MRLTELKKLDWRRSAFWKALDSLGVKQRISLVRAVGSSADIRKKYRDRVNNCTAKGLSITLSVMDYAALLYVAGVKIDEVSSSGFNLSRVNDCGGYRRGNCRFITHTENMKEQKTSDKQRAAAKRNSPLGIKAIQDRRKEMKKNNPEQYKEYCKRFGKRRQKD